MTQKLPPIYTANHATFPIQIRKITVQICGNFWVTQYYGSPLIYVQEVFLDIIHTQVYKNYRDLKYKTADSFIVNYLPRSDLKLRLFYLTLQNSYFQTIIHPLFWWEWTRSGNTSKKYLPILFSDLLYKMGQYASWTYSI